MKKLLVLFTLIMGLFANTAFADTKEIRRGTGVVDLWIMLDGPYANYRIINVPPNDYKIVYQVSATNTNTGIAYCNRVLQEADPNCEVYDPDPIYAAWDAAQQVNGQNLTPANRRQWLYVWHYESNILKRMRSVRNWLTTQSGYTLNRQRNTFIGTLLGWNFPTADAEACAVIMIDNGLTCNWDETGRDRMDNIEKRIADELHDAVIEL